MPRKLTPVLMYADHAWCDFNDNTNNIKKHSNENTSDAKCYLFLCTASHDFALTSLAATLGGAFLEGVGWSVMSTADIALSGTLGAASCMLPILACNALCNSVESTLDTAQQYRQKDPFLRGLSSSAALGLTSMIGASVQGMNTGTQLGYAAASGAIGGAGLFLTSLALITIGKYVFVKCCTNNEESFVVNYSNTGQTRVTPAALQAAINKNGFLTSDEFIQHLRTEAEKQKVDPLEILSAFMKTNEVPANKTNMNTALIMN